MSRQNLRSCVAGHRLLQSRAVGSGIGPAVSNRLPVPVDVGGAPSDHQGGSGATPLMATTSVVAPATQASTALGEPRATLTAAGLQRQRMKWTKEINISVMRAYYRSTKVETEVEGFRARMHAEWRRIYPDSQLDEQRVCSQMRSILSRKALSAAELDQIKKETRAELQQQQGPMEEVGNDGGSNETDEPVGEPSEISHEEEQTESQNGCEFKQKLQDMFEENKLRYAGMQFGCRPRIPKLHCNTATYERVAYADSLLYDDIDEDCPLLRLADLVHCAALSVCQSLGIKVTELLEEQEKVAKQKKKNPESYVPPWRKSIEDRILKARKEIGHITAYFATMPENRSKRMVREIKSIARNMRLKKSDRKFDKKLKERMEQLKQRIAALGARIRRYNEAAKRRQQERNFISDQKLFYRKLEQEGQERLPQQPPSASTMATFWAGIWSSPEVHNEDAYWMAEEVDAMKDTPEMPAVSIMLADIQAAVKKTQNWKAPGGDGIHNFWWKYFKSTHGHEGCFLKPAEPSAEPLWS